MSCVTKRMLFCLLAFMLLAMSSNAISEECPAMSCFTEFQDSVPIGTSVSAYCRAYNKLKACVVRICGSSYPTDIFDAIEEMMKKQGIECNSGRNVGFSLAIIFGCVLFAIRA